MAYINKIKLPGNNTTYDIRSSITSAIPMGTVDSTSTSTAFTATVEGITELKDGVCLYLNNSVINCASGFTVNINGLGAKGMYSNKTGSRISGYFSKNITVMLVYNTSRDSGNGGWDVIVDDNTTYSNAALGQGYGTCTTAAATAAKVVTLSSYVATPGGIVSVKFSYDVPASATMNINSKGAKAIYYRGAAITAGVIKAGDTATFIYSTYYHLISIDRDDNTSAVTGVKGDAEQSFRTGNVSITPANIGAVALTGNTITGDIQRKQTEIDASKANNNISATKYPTTYSIIDNANRILVRNEAIVESSGNISWYAYVRNYNTSGSQVAQKGIKYSVNKSGTGIWTVDDATSFRSAIGAGTYSKGSDGIPKTDLASAVQTSLGKADTALQSHQTIKQDGVTGATVNRFGTCGTAAATAAKTVSITSGTFSLEAGARVTVKFTYDNTANTPTLNVNSKGAKNIYSKGSQITTGSNKSLLAGTVDFIYDGTQWHLIGNYIDTNTNTHRPIQVNGTQLLGNNDTAFNLSAGGHVRIRLFDDEPNRAHIHNASWTSCASDIHVSLNDLNWTPSANGMYSSTNYTPNLGDYVIRYFYGVTILDFNYMTPVFIMPCVGFSSPTIWFMSSTGTFPSNAELIIRVFYPVFYEDNN